MFHRTLNIERSHSEMLTFQKLSPAVTDFPFTSVSVRVNHFKIMLATLSESLIGGAWIYDLNYNQGMIRILKQNWRTNGSREREDEKRPVKPTHDMHSKIYVVLLFFRH